MLEKTQIHVTELIVDDPMALAITSMARVGHRIYLGLTGGSRILAVYDTQTGKISMEKELFPWVTGRGHCSKIHNAMGALADGSLLIGEGNHFTWDGIPVTTGYLSRELPESMLERKRRQGYPDIQYSDFCLDDLSNWDRTKDSPGGVIMQYHPETGETTTLGRLPDYLYVQSMVVDAKNERAYGHTIPDNHFFSVDLRTKKIRDYGHISDYAHHNLVVAPNGVCYGGWIDKADGSLRLLKFDPDRGRLEYRPTIILQDPGSKVAGNQGIDQWLVTRDGDVYVGMVANSLLYRFRFEEETFELVGQLAKGGRVTSIDEDEEGNIWIGADYPHMRLIRFDPRASGSARFKDFGRVNTSYPRCYFHASGLHDGKLYLGETDGFSPSLHIVEGLPAVRF